MSGASSMRLRFLATVLVVFGAAVTTGCGKSPTAPTPTTSSTEAPTSSGCSFTVANGPDGPIPAAGGEFTIAITTTAACSWIAASNAPFIAAISATTGTGNGSVKFSVGANSGASRQGAVQVAGRAVTISQAAGTVGCEFSLDPVQPTVSAAGGSVSITLTRTSGANCDWTSASNDSFISVQSGAVGTDSGTVVLTIASNGGAARTGTATIAGRVVTVSQAAAANPCIYSLTPAVVSMPFTGGTAQIVAHPIGNPPGCSWTAQSNSSFVTVSPTSGTISGAVVVTVAANSGAARSGSVTIGGQIAAINQADAPSSGTLTVLSYQSDPGDFVGAGGSKTYTLAGSQIELTLSAAQNQLNVRMPFNGVEFWNLVLKSGGGPLGPGTYNEAARASFAPPGAPGLDFGNGRGCNQLTGRFLIQTAVFSGTDVQRFHARFEQHCEGWSTPLRGEIWIDAAGGSPPALANFPTPGGPFTQVTYTSEPGDGIGQGGSGSFTLSGLRFSAWASPSRPAVNIRMQTASGPITTSWRFDFAAVSGTRLQPGTYPGAVRYSSSSGVPGLNVSGSGGACNTLTGSFVVLEAVYGPQGEVLRFHATFDQYCDGAAAALRGEVRIVADPWR